MTKDTPWTAIGSYSATELSAARIELHWAAQILGATADALLSHAEDDSHTNLFWNDAYGALVGRELPGQRQIGLAFADFSLLAIEGGEIKERKPLAGMTLSDGLAWAGKTFALPQALSVRDYDMPEHAVAKDGAAFSSPDAGFAELGYYFAAATATLEEFARENDGATSVAVWPHHFDIGGIIFLQTDASIHEAQQIGFGLSPGDGNIAEPYFYITPWPIAEDAEITTLKGGGYWHTAGFTGALLLASTLTQVEAAQRANDVAGYLSSAVEAGRALISQHTAK